MVGCVCACVRAGLLSCSFFLDACAYACNVCISGFYRLSGMCVPCPSSPIVLVIGCLLIIVALAVAGYFLNSYKVNLAFVSIAIDYVQVVSILLDSNIAWPPLIVNLRQVLSAAPRDSRASCREANQTDTILAALAVLPGPGSADNARS